MQKKTFVKQNNSNSLFMFELELYLVFLPTYPKKDLPKLNLPSLILPIPGNFIFILYLSFSNIR